MVVLLGGLAAFALTQLPTTKTTTPTTGGGGHGVTTTTAGGTSALHAALVAACVSDYTTVSTAVSIYTTLHGAKPPAGTAWATSGGPGSRLLQLWPSGEDHFTLRWNGASIVVDPARGTPSVGSTGTSSPPTGCEAA